MSVCMPRDAQDDAGDQCPKTGPGECPGPAQHRGWDGHGLDATDDPIETESTLATASAAAAALAGFTGAALVAAERC